MLDTFFRTIKKFIPRELFSALQPAYHYGLALLGALIYRFPSKRIFVVAITGTKGKTSTVELVNALLEDAGHKTALSSTLRFKIGDESVNNTYKMTLPGRFFLQHFLRRAVNAGCEYAVIEMTSEGAKQYRHKFVSLDALIFTNLAPEHIESHGSFEAYAAAKLSIAESVAHSAKKRRIIVANADDRYGEKFLTMDVSEKYPYSAKDAEPYEIKREGVSFAWKGQRIESRLSGLFNIYNMLAAATFAKSVGVSDELVRKTLGAFGGIPGRMEYITMPPDDILAKTQDFTVIVDYAHTPDSLEKVYQVFQNTRKICVLGGTGGGRDTWKRPIMGKIANDYCDHIILTDEDPYDENPDEIVAEVKSGITSPNVEIKMDRREAIAEALSHTRTGDVVIITGKGTDPYIMGPGGSKLPWNDARIAREELKRRLAHPPTNSSTRQ